MVTGAWAQQTRPTNPAPNRNAPPTRSSFTAKGLKSEQDLTDFFVGNFADIPYDRGSAAFSALFQQYLEAYARHCGASLPVKNRVEMTRQFCADPPRLPGLPPPAPGTDSCSTWRTVSLGYADPALYEAKSELDKDHLASHVTDALGLNAKSLKDFMASARDVLQLPSDMDALVRRNACDGGGLRRFQENVALLSKGEAAVAASGRAASGGAERPRLPGHAGPSCNIQTSACAWCRCGSAKRRGTPEPGTEGCRVPPTSDERSPARRRCDDARFYFLPSGPVAITL